MTEEDIARVATLADICSAKGIRSVRVGDVSLEFSPPTEAPMADKPWADAEKCRCGHAVHAHINALCVLGCSPEQCTDSPERSG